MATLLLRLAAPLQSWGIDSKFDTRKTEREPSKSGVMGLLAAALGYKRYEADKLSQLNELRFGVRTDREGTLLRDYHMVHGEKIVHGKRKNDDIKTYETKRYYLADAVFVVGLEGSRETLETLAYALSHPVYPLYLGRRSCPPTLPLCLGIREGSLIEALEKEPPLVSQKEGTMRITVDASNGDSGVAARHDLPISFDPRRRRYGYRNVVEKTIAQVKKNTPPEHDPFAELEDE